jgi:hypothetical protein
VTSASHGGTGTAAMAEMDKLNVGEPEFFDLRRPVLQSPR